MAQDIDFPTLVKTQFDAVAALGDVMARDVGKIVVEAQECSVAAMQSHAELARKLAAATSVADVIELQGAHVRSAYETAVARSKKFGELFTELSRDAIKTVAVGADKAKTPIAAPQMRVNPAQGLQAAE